MHTLHRSHRTRRAASWLLVLAIVFGAFAPGWHALANAAGPLDPSRELCSLYGVSPASPGDPAPASSGDGGNGGQSHCSTCPSPLLAGLLPVGAPAAPQDATSTPVALPPGSALPATSPRRWTAPRGPPGLA